MGQIKQFHRPIDESGSMNMTRTSGFGRRRMHSENVKILKRQLNPVGGFNDPIDFSNYKINGPIVPVNLNEINNEFGDDYYEEDNNSLTNSVNTGQQEASDEHELNNY